MVVNKPKITILSYNFLPNDGGIARLAYSLYLELLAQDYPTQIITMETPPESASKNFHVVPRTRFLREIKTIKKLNEINSDIIISTIWYPEALLSFCCPAKHRITLLHGSELLPNDNFWKRFIQKPFLNYSLRKSSLLVANSDFTKRLAHNINTSAKIKVVSPAVDAGSFFPIDKKSAKEKFNVSNKFVLSTISVIQQHKGFSMVFKAISQLPEKLKSNIVYLIGGQGPDTSLLKKEAQDLQIDHLIQWTDYVPDQDLNSFYNATDLFLLCSQERYDIRSVEGFGMVLLEAQAAGVPVIGTNAGGIPNAINTKKGGYLIEAHDVKGLQSLISKIYKMDTIEKQKLDTLALENALDKNWTSYLDDLMATLR